MHVLARHHCLCWTTVLLAGSLAATCGCEEPEPSPVAYMGPTLASEDLGITREAERPTGYVIVEDEPSVGRFPASLAVARLEPPGMATFRDDPNRNHWRIGTMPEEEATYWNALFNTIPFVRDVLVLDELVVMWPDADQDDINVAARRLDSDLCLIYGPTAAPPEHAAFAGIIRDTETGRAVATVRARGGPSDALPPPDDTFKEDLRYRDPNYLAARKFEWQVRRCIAELQRRDQPAPTTQPSEWRQHGLERKRLPLYIIPRGDDDVRW